MLVHDTENVRGIKTLRAHKDMVRYAYAETPLGGRIDIVTTDRQTLAALHLFLKYQIAEHHTGDSGQIVARP
jgi:hypothetical protein